MSFAVGSLVRARDREWVVLPGSASDLILLRPLGGTDDEVTGILPEIETVTSATFAPPDPTRPGDYRSGRWLRDAVRLGFRASAGPFRSFARLNFDPRPYQLVPLMMALRLDPIRLLIADDVGIGKTIEACLIARELIDRGEVERTAVLCPPHLAEQWQAELREKFHIQATLVLSGTAARLERGLRLGESLFERHPHVVVSTDFIKSERRRHEFVRMCPELVIVDEAHTCVSAGEGRSAAHQRHQLLNDISRDETRHLVLVTATPHSGNEQAFRSLLALLNESLVELPADLAGEPNAPHRKRLAQHFVQRRRADIEHFMQADTPFPERKEAEETYQLTPEYRRLFERVLEYTRESVADTSGGAHRRRVRWWSALGLLRALASSPAAAAATLRNRAAGMDVSSSEEADELGRRNVLDLTEDEPPEGVDVAPGGDALEGEDATQPERRRLRDLARQADDSRGDGDAKLQKAIRIVSKLLDDGYRPIVFCRFIATAEYVADTVRTALGARVEVAAVTGILPPEEREERIAALAEHAKRVLVCTDCLSEGINLQDHFDAVLHYDLSWNPTRHEQRDGRVDRFGQRRGEVRVVTYYSPDTRIDGIVLDVLIRKHRTIRNSLGISVPVPIDTDRVIEAIFEGLLLRQKGDSAQQLRLFEDYFRPKRDELFASWEVASEREKRSRTLFAQETLKPDEVARELDAVRAAIGSGIDLREFVSDVLRSHGALVRSDGRLEIDLRETPAALREALGGRASLAARFEPPVRENETHLTRTHPIVEGLASWMLDTALDPLADGRASRCGVVRTREVTRRSTLLVVRYRFHIVTRIGDDERPLLAEDVGLMAFEGPANDPTWLDAERAEALLTCTPSGNISADQAHHFLQPVINAHEALQSGVAQEAQARARTLLEAHRRVRSASAARGIRYHVEPQLPPDVLGVYVFLPAS